MATETEEKVKRLPTMNAGEAAQLKELDEAESCPTCGGPMKVSDPPIPESELGPEQGGSHGRMARMTHTDFPGYRQRTLKRGERIGGGY